MLQKNRNKTKISRQHQHFVLLQSECTRCGAYLVEIKNEDENKWIEEYLLQDVCKHKFITFLNEKLAVENNVL